jgi:AraC-like DNA-binding protein
LLLILWVTRGTAGQALSPSVISVLGADSEVVEATGSTKALWQLSHSRPFDVVVMECGLGDRRQNHVGFVDLIRSMFRRWPWMPVVLVGAAPERLRADVLLTGVRAFLTRRFTVGRLSHLVARVARRHGTPVPSTGSVATMKRVFAFLDEHAGETPSLRDLARMTQMSRSHFSRTFHSVAGMPLRGYVRELRLKRAHELLVSGKLSLTAVAVESGFYDLPHFDKAFRRRLGTSPRAFRARHAHAAR